VDLAPSTRSHDDLSPGSDTEALQVLTDRAEHRKAGALAGALARRALAITSGGGFALARDALDAMLRRLDAEAAEVEAESEADAETAQAQPREAGEPDRAVAGALASGKLTLDVSDLAATLSQISIRPLEGGRISVELPRAAATSLGGLLRALASAVEGGPARDASRQGEGASAS
jgi:hypothetical protein